MEANNGRNNAFSANTTLDIMNGVHRSDGNATTNVTLDIVMGEQYTVAQYLQEGYSTVTAVFIMKNGATAYYPIPVHKTPFYKKDIKLPLTDWAANSVLSLPVNPLVREDDLHKISKVMHAVIKK